ncbi:hypothetical protein [Mesorhizobium sp. M1163]
MALLTGGAGSIESVDLPPQSEWASDFMHPHPARGPIAGNS